MRRNTAKVHRCATTCRHDANSSGANNTNSLWRFSSLGLFCLAVCACIYGSRYLWPSDRTPSTATRVSTNTVRRVPYRRPYVSDRENFLTVFSLGLGHDSLKFSDRNFGKKFGKKFPPRGVRPPKFFWSNYSSPRAMCLQTFIAISQKLYPVGVSKIRAHKMKKKNKVADTQLKPEVLSLWHLYSWIGPRALNLSRDIVLPHHFRFLHNRPKTVFSVEIFLRYRFNKVSKFGKPITAP